MFTDEAELHVQAGKGGKGLVSFRREKYVPYGGPNGGDGGKGGDVIFRVKKSLRTLSHIRSRSVFTASNGQDGMTQDKTGKNGESCMIDVPIGTIIKNSETKEIIADLNNDGDELIIASGGRGGKGNPHYASSTNQTPQYAQPGTLGEAMDIFLELKLIADIGLVGFPNAGKSTLLSHLTNAKPKIASYPFTTLHPNLGVVNVTAFETYTIADIPGLLEGAHQGVGLGIQFLKHIERTKGLLYMIDFSVENSFQQFQLLQNELRSFNKKLLMKPFYIAFNKVDLYTEEIKKEKIDELLAEFQHAEELFFISAATGEGLLRLKKKLLFLLQATISE